MCLHKELHAVRPRKNLQWFRPVTAEVRLDFAAPSALSACSHPSPGWVKHWSCVTWRCWHVGDATDVRWKRLLLQCLAEAAPKTRSSRILTASKWNLRQVSRYLGHFSHWAWFMPGNLFLVTVYKLLFVNNLEPSSCFPHLWYASTWVLFKSPIWLKHSFPTNQVKGGIKHPSSGCAELSWWLQVAHPAPRLEGSKRCVSVSTALTIPSSS